MGEIKRQPFQGVWNIIRFNWHFYVLAIVLIFVLALLGKISSLEFIEDVTTIVIFLITASFIISLAVSYYVYDVSGFYNLQWLDFLQIPAQSTLVNINAGFDETSHILKQKYPDSELKVLDFYDPEKHTEISIKRARKAYPSYPGTETISTTQIPLGINSADYIFLIFAAHEIRNHAERTAFFRRLAGALRLNGRIIVVEHKKDLANFLAYNFGFFHFYSQKIWNKTFAGAGLTLVKYYKLTPFTSTFVLAKNGVTS